MKSKKQELHHLNVAQRVLFALILVLPMGVAHAQAWLLAPSFTTPGYSLIDRWANNQIWKNVTKVDCDTNPFAKKMNCRYIGNSKENSNPQARQSGTSSALLSTGKDFATTQGLEEMAALYPVQNREEAVKTYTRLIISFNQKIAPAYNIPKNNMASAMTVALAGGYAAYTNRPFPENAVKPLFQQSEQALLHNPQMLSLSIEQRASMYQKSVGGGMLFLMQQAELAKHPDAKNEADLKKNGAAFFRTINLDPDRLSFTDKGMKLQ